MDKWLNGFYGIYYFIDGIITIPCCNSINPNLDGYILFKFFPIKICSNCGQTHNKFGKTKLSLFIFCLENYPATQIPITFVNHNFNERQVNWHIQKLNSAGHEFEMGSENHFPSAVKDLFIILKTFLQRKIQIFRKAGGEQSSKL